MANSVCEIALLAERLSTKGGASPGGAGAVVEFRGIVRPLERGQPLRGIEYEAHQRMAEHQLRTISQEAIVLFNLFTVKIEHRVGYVPVGETSLYLRISSAHRGEGFAASKWIVDELKKRVPIWKNPIFQLAGKKMEKASVTA